ncbi:hypothetical protein T11_5954 [Trichinella zimbabwensis]|uniref:Uncharacterized protein n=1 Tax=Trichinella zimbabwensis TaxID=268475 RepID=A0A0V1GE07_9BILA|nr:hypothetical protein T11_5954 [Trichinella zimbabwensis]
MAPSVNNNFEKLLLLYGLLIANAEVAMCQRMRLACHFRVL